jgi:hypothetical protein
MSEQQSGTSHPIETTLISPRTAVSLAIAVFGWGAIGFFALAEASAAVWRPLTIVFYVLFLLGAVAFIFLAKYLVSNIEELFPGAEEQLSLEYLALSCGALLALVVGFSQLCKHLSFYFGGFSPTTDNFWDWTRFGVSWLTDNVLANLSQIFQWHISDIQAVSVWSEVLVWVFNVVLDVLAIVTVVQAFNRARSNRGRAQRELPNGYVGFLLLGLGELLIAVLWIVPFLLFIGAIAERDLSLGASWPAIRNSALPVIGLWLLWRSASGAIRLTGFFNKLLAVFTLAAGLAVLYFTVPTLLAYLLH